MDDGDGRIDCFDAESGNADFGSVAEIHREMVESVVEVDDAELEKYLSGKKLDLSELRQTFVKAMSLGQVVPVLFTNAKDMSLKPGAEWTVIPNDGISFPETKRQLISFVRALVFEPDILILDEATSSIDPENRTLPAVALAVVP